MNYLTFETYEIRVIVRFDTTNERIDMTQISDSDYYNGHSILPISNSEVFFSYRSHTDYDRHHIVKADYTESGGRYSLDEKNHQRFTRQSFHASDFCLGESNDTIWHSLNMEKLGVAFIELNLTSFSLIGMRNFLLFDKKYYTSIRIEAGEGIV